MTKKKKYIIISHAEHASEGFNEVAFGITDLDAFRRIAKTHGFKIIKIIEQKKSHLDDFCDVT